MSTLRHRIAAAAVVASTSLGVIGLAAGPAAAHEAHKLSNVYGSTAGCQGGADISGYRLNDLGSDHRTKVEVSLVRANHCLRVATTTWSDNFWAGFRHWVSFTIKDSRGYELMTTSGARFGVDGTWSSFHARLDYYTIDLPQWVADQAHTIVINNWRN